MAHSPEEDEIYDVDVPAGAHGDTLSEDPYVLVAALDFGTTFSGYAFSFKSTPNDIQMNKNWGENVGFMSFKTPTSVLTDNKGEFLAFGYEAEERYFNLIEENNARGYNMYRHFKMVLHKSAAGLSRKTEIASETGHRRPAMDIFEMSIRYLKDHLINRLSEMVDSEPNVSLVKWVLTVPAIWNETAKQFMREAAYKAGCIDRKDSDQLLIALEPEVASMYCRRVDINRFGVQEVEGGAFKSGTKYLVIDAGGGTVDITAHEVLITQGVKELSVASGGAWGGTEVDKTFVALLSDVLGKSFVEDFQKSHPAQFLNIMTSFEKTKKLISKDSKSTKIILSIPWSLGKIYAEKTGKDFEKTVTDERVSGVTFTNGALVIDHDASVALFDGPVNRISDHVKWLLQSSNLQGLSYVMLVGGFGESKVLQESIKNILPENIKLLVPPEAQLAVIKGAIHFGYHSNEIQSRIVRKTYGADTMRYFDEKIHEPGRKRILGDDKAWCDDVFQQFIIKGELVDCGQVIEKKRTPVYDKQTGMTIDIYCTDKKNLDEVEYVDRPYMSRLGGIYIEMPNVEKNFDRAVMVQFIFGQTEFQVKAVDSDTGVTAETSIDFLTD